MKSRISIDVDHDNQPIIKIDYVPSEDVRDKLVKKFMETFSGHLWARFLYADFSNPDYIKTTVIRPIKLEELNDEWQSMKQTAEEHERMRNQVEMPVKSF